MDLVTDYAWIGWIAIIAILLVIEMLSGELTFLMLSIGGVAGVVSSLLGAPIWLQVIVVAVVAVVLLLFIRPPLLKRVKRPRDPQKFNVDALMGIAGTVQQAVSPTTGTVKLSNGQTWTARTSTARQIPSGALIYVQQVSGATVYVIDQPIPPTNTGEN
ncbi:MULTISPECIES: NfeD family protein [unclassified Microbacterium]|uniref:NfeD family protein n=1 Tax=unclassified Microbacterium TaxID=2609290 RepID=UPI00097ECAEE|nr:NfeD family protein [Microbacterium sp. JB110]RCS62992.1 NfeD family protein [Microbacterium sp. JB110]SJM60915.1 Putative activity regulator of membrane protease YbbK [Frigoribacterium sp. JB110]